MEATGMSLNTRESFNEVLAFYSDMVYRLAFSRVGNSFDAHDVLQEVFLRYIRSDKTYTDEEHRKAWLITVTINCSKSLLMSSWNKHVSDEELDENKGDYDKSIRQIEMNSTVYKAVMELSPKYRTVIHLFYYEDLPINKISQVTGLSENTVKTQLARARKILKEKLEGVDFDDI